MDGKFDLLISQRLYSGWSDNSDRMYLEDYNFPFYGLELKNGLEVASKKEAYSVGHGYTNSMIWVDTIHYESRINKINNWRDSNTKSWMWCVPPAFFWGSNGCWYKLTNTEMYIGIRMKINSEYKFGWIKVKVYSRDNFEILSYSIKK